MQNTKNFTCLGKNHGAPVLSATKEEWLQMRQEEWLKEMCHKIEEGDEQLKHTLPVWTPSCAEFNNNHRAKADALKPLNRLMIDFDDKGHTDDIMQCLTPVADSKEHTIGGMTVLLVEESVRKGTHVLILLPEGMTASEAQQRMEEATGLTPDKSVKDVSRCIYMVSDDHTRYVSDLLFEAEVSEAKQESLSQAPVAEATTTPEKAIPCFGDLPYNDIINEWWNQRGGEPKMGERNTKLYQLALKLRAICDNNEHLLLQIMPSFGLSEDEMRTIIHSACKETLKEISKELQFCIDACRKGKDEDGGESEDKPSLTKMLNKLPIGLRESLIGVPDNMKMQVLCAVLPIAATYADMVEVEYSDNEKQHLGLMAIIYGEQASGKSVCKSAVDVWLTVLSEEDTKARAIEEKWKAANKTRKANEKGVEDPKVMIRELPITVSCSTLLKRQKNAQGHTLYSFCEEFDTLRKTNGAGSWSAKYDIYRLAFDRGKWGQDYNSDQAESGIVEVAYNWTVLGTEGCVRKCFHADNIENGLSSRMLIAKMPDSAFAKMPRYKHRTEEENQRIVEASKILSNCKGFVDTPRLRKAIDDWEEKMRLEAIRDIDRVKDTFRRRAGVIAFRAGVIFHLLTGKERESKACIDFALMMADYVLKEQIRIFGDKLSSQYVVAEFEGQRSGVNKKIFDELPVEFTRQEVRALKPDCSDSGFRNILSRWVTENWIVETSKNHYRKIAG